MFDRADMDDAPHRETEAETFGDATDAEPMRTMQTGRNRPEDDREDRSRGRFDLYRLIIERLARFTLVILAVIAIGAVWGVGILSLSTSPTLAGRAFGVAVDITVALLIADLVVGLGQDRHRSTHGEFFRPRTRPHAGA